MRNFESDAVSVKEMCLFLSEYSSRLLASGATCIRLEKNIGRIARRYGMEVEMAVMPRHIHTTVYEKKEGAIFTSINAVPETGINFSINTELSRLSWKIADEEISFDDSLTQFREIVSGKRTAKSMVLLLVALANASFCRLFGGDVYAMVTVGAATFAGYYIKQLLISKHCDNRLIFIICSLVSTILGSTDILFSIGSTPDIAIGTSVLYLIPGIPFLNSFSDLLYRHYLCAFSRFCDAMMLTASLSIGLIIGLRLMDVNIF